MTSEMGISLQGSQQLIDNMSELKNAMRRGILQKAVRKAGRTLVPSLRSATPKSLDKFGKQAARNPSGTLRKSTGLVVRKYKGGSVASAYVGHRYKKGGQAAHLVDAGTADRQTKKGFNRGRIVGAQFFRPVWQAGKSRAATEMKNEIALGLQQARAKLAIKGAVRNSVSI